MDAHHVPYVELVLMEARLQLWCNARHANVCLDTCITCLTLAVRKQQGIFLAVRRDLFAASSLTCMNDFRAV